MSSNGMAMSRLGPQAFRRGVCLVVGFVTIMLSGVTLTFATFQPNLKNEFNLQQTSLEVIASLGTIGASLGYPVGLTYEWLGSVRAFLLASVVGTVSGMLLYSTQYSNAFYSQNWGLIALYWTLFGVSSLILFLVSVTVNLDNFPRRHRGLIMGLTGAAWWLGSAVIAAIFNSCYSHTPVGDFFLMVAILNLILCGLSAWLVRPLPALPEENSEWQTLTPGENQEPAEPKPQLSMAERYGLDMLYLADFHILTWAFLFAASIQLTYIPNVTAFTASYGLTHYNYALTVASPVCACVWKFFTGWISDHTKKYFPRLMYVILMTFIQLLLSLLSIFFGDNDILFIMTIVLVYMSNGCFWSIIPTIISEYFGMRHFSRNWGFEFFANSLLMFISLAIFGAFYEDAIQINNSSDCYRLKCFRNFYILASVMSAISFVLFCWLYRREKKGLTPRKH